MSDTVQSPTTLILNYLKANGRQPNAQNIRTVLEQNARDPTLIPGLRNETPDAPDKGPGVGQRGSVAGKVEGGGKPLPEPPIPPSDGSSAAPTDTSKTSAQPSQSTTQSQGIPSVDDYGRVTSDSPGGGGAALGATILGGLPLVGRYLTGNGQPGAAPPQPAAPPATPDAAAPDPLKLSLDRATQPALGSGASDADLAAILGNGGMPPGVSNLDAVNAANSTPGQGLALPQASSQPEPGEGPIPLRRKVTVEEIPHTQPHAPATNFRSRPPMRLFVP